MTVRIGTSRVGGRARNLTSAGTADVQLTPTLKGAWKVQYTYRAFGREERRPGPAGLAPFVAAMLCWNGVNRESAELVLRLADPGEVESDGSVILSGDEETVGRFLAGELETARLFDHSQAEQAAQLFESRPERGDSAGWKKWFRTARTIRVICTPRGFDIPDDDPLHCAYDYAEEPADEPVKSA